MVGSKVPSPKYGERQTNRRHARSMKIVTTRRSDYGMRAAVCLAGNDPEVLVTAAPRDKVAEHLRFLAQADVEPSAINVDAMALFSVMTGFAIGAITGPDPGDEA